MGCLGVDPGDKKRSPAHLACVVTSPIRCSSREDQYVGDITDYFKYSLLWEFLRLPYLREALHRVNGSHDAAEWGFIGRLPNKIGFGRA